MNRRNFLKFAPALVAVPVVAIAAASNKIAPPTVASLPFTFEGRDGLSLVIKEVDGAIAIDRSDYPDNAHGIMMRKPTPALFTGNFSEYNDLRIQPTYRPGAVAQPTPVHWRGNNSILYPLKPA